MSLERSHSPVTTDDSMSPETAELFAAVAAAESELLNAHEDDTPQLASFQRSVSARNRIRTQRLVAKQSARDNGGLITPPNVSLYPPRKTSRGLSPVHLPAASRPSSVRRRSLSADVRREAEGESPTLRTRTGSAVELATALTGSVERLKTAV